ncbi:MAG: hypothetical protein ACTHK4_12700 [Mycobacteriales bacterium]
MPGVVDRIAVHRVGRSDARIDIERTPKGAALMTDKLERLPRCCAQHDSWQVLAEHLCIDFPAVSSDQVLRNILDVQAVSQRFDLDDREALDIGELVVRYRLMVATGQIPDVARTDPQTHHMGGASSEGDFASTP